MEKISNEKKWSKRKNNDERLQYIRYYLSEFVNNGGNVNDLTVKDPIYQLVKNTSIFVDGRQLTVAEKFKIAGFPRNEMDNVYVYNRLLNLGNFEIDGYVDSFRRNNQMNNFIDTCAEKYNVPNSIIVSLFADKNLRFYNVDVENLKTNYLVWQLNKHLKQYHSFHGLRRINPNLFGLIRTMKNSSQKNSGLILSTKEFMNQLGYSKYLDAFKDVEISQFEPDEFIEKYKQVIIDKNYSIGLSDIKSADYKKLANYIRRKDISFPEFFALYGIKYKVAKKVKRDKIVYMPEYPYLAEMKQLRNEIFERNIKELISHKRSLSENEIIEIHIKSCVESYNYYHKIFSNELKSVKSPDEQNLE